MPGISCGYRALYGMIPRGYAAVISAIAVRLSARSFTTQLRPKWHVSTDRSVCRPGNARSEFIHTLFRRSGKNDSFHFCGRSAAIKCKSARRSRHVAARPVPRLVEIGSRVSYIERRSRLIATRPSKQIRFLGHEGFAKYAIGGRASGAKHTSLVTPESQEDAYDITYTISITIA